LFVKALLSWNFGGFLFGFVFEKGSHYIAQGSLELLGLSDSVVSAS
jgi:hypothetical protein